MSPECRCWAVVPAAGLGRRMGSAVPKQHLSLLGRTVLEHSLARLVEHPAVRRVYVALSPEDRWWPDNGFFGHPGVVAVGGGAERCQSVLNALRALDAQGAEDDWVLVHDAARPCVRPDDITRLVDQLWDHPVGGLLGSPVRDTMKRVDARAQVAATVAREGLWHAFTPQMFRLGPLRAALESAVSASAGVTDESSALERAGARPLLVEGAADNIKITRTEDLALAAFYLQHQQLGAA